MEEMIVELRNLKGIKDEFKQARKEIDELLKEQGRIRIEREDRRGKEGI